MKTLFSLLLLGTMALGQAKSSETLECFGDLNGTVEPCTKLMAKQAKPEVKNVPQVVYPNTYDNGVLTLSDPNTAVTNFVIGGAQGMAVNISMADGKVTFGDGYNPDEASKEFWKFIEKNYSGFCPAPKPEHDSAYWEKYWREKFDKSAEKAAQK